jgi:Transposase DDE domain
VPQEASRKGLFAKSAFEIDLHNERVSCPAGQVTTPFSTTPEGGQTFGFGALCCECALRSQCTTAAKGRTVSVHAQEALLQSARAYPKSPEGRARLRERVVIEHRLARLGQ